MKIKLIAFTCITTSLLLCMGLWRIDVEYSQEARLASQVEHLTHQLHEAKIGDALSQARLADLQQEVAMYLPDDKSQNADDRLRDVASIIPHQSRPMLSDEYLSKKNLTAAIQLFEEKKYDESSKAFLDLVSQYPDSSAALQSHYYMVQNFYLTNNKQEAIDWSGKMLKHFPDSIWTAKAMLTIADIYLEQDKKNEALEVYSTLMASFDSPDLKKEIKERLSKIGQ